MTDWQAQQMLEERQQWEQDEAAQAEWDLWCKTLEKLRSEDGQR